MYVCIYIYIYIYTHTHTHTYYADSRYDLYLHYIYRYNVRIMRLHEVFRYECVETSEERFTKFILITLQLCFPSPPPQAGFEWGKAFSLSLSLSLSLALSRSLSLALALSLSRSLSSLSLSSGWLRGGQGETVRSVARYP
jgi:hypothetical protein